MTLSTQEIEQRVRSLGQWFHNIDLQGVKTAPDHFLGDYPTIKWSSYYRHFYMGVLREDGTPKLALEQLADYTPELGICQWFHFEDPRVDDAVAWLRTLGMKRLRTGLSWADSHRPNARAWFDRR